MTWGEARVKAKDRLEWKSKVMTICSTRMKNVWTHSQIILFFQQIEVIIDLTLLSSFEDELLFSRAGNVTVGDAEFDSFPEELCWHGKKASTTVDQVEMFNSCFASIESSSLSSE
ncbi:hypothetical protein BpHYR1_012314, partial [Brachionus plicatilis]